MGSAVKMAAWAVGLVCVGMALVVVDGANCDGLSNGVFPDGFCARVFASDLSSPRGLWASPSGDILVLERDEKRVTALWDSNGDGVSSSSERAVLCSAPNLNHGLALHNGFLYASSKSTVYRWAYSGQRTALGSYEEVVKNVDVTESGTRPEGHITRTLAFDSQGRLYISVGSTSNVDSSSFRARIRRFSLSSIPSGGIDFTTGEVFADGLRNEVGLAFDDSGVLWGVENGADQLSRSDLGGDIHKDNPAEELNRFPESQAGKFYGYPYCWSEYSLPAYGKGRTTQWAWPSFMNDGVHTDEWCRNKTNNIPPLLGMQAHSAPLGLAFYTQDVSKKCGTGTAFPCSLKGDAFVPFHGSWNRDPATGYKVVHVKFGSDGLPTGSVEDFLASKSGGVWPEGRRPVDARFSAEGHLYVSSDDSGEVFVITYVGDSAAEPSPSRTPSTGSPAASSSPRVVTNMPEIKDGGVALAPCFVLGVVALMLSAILS